MALNFFDAGWVGLSSTVEEEKQPPFDDAAPKTPFVEQSKQLAGEAELEPPQRGRRRSFVCRRPSG
jgi:hypothetical protein